MRVAVTGGVGFIGSHVVDHLAARAHDVAVLDSLHPAAHRGPPEYLNAAATYHWHDLARPADLCALLEGVDAVCHHASRVGLGRDFADVVDYVHDNDLGTARLLRALHHTHFAGRIVLASSMVVYGEGRYSCSEHGSVRAAPRSSVALAAGDFEPPCPHCGAPLAPEPVTEDAPTDPRSVYAATKLHQEHLCAAFGREHDVAVTSLRYHNVYGPRMPENTPYAGVASIFRSALSAGRPPSVFEDGRQLRDFIHVDDVARSVVLALERADPYNGPLNVASGTPHTVGELARELCAATDAGLAPIVTGETRAGDVRHVFASTELAHAHLGFIGTIDFTDGIAAFARAPLRRASC